MAVGSGSPGFIGVLGKPGSTFLPCTGGDGFSCSFPPQTAAQRAVGERCVLTSPRTVPGLQTVPEE